jgi:hypothetical protein
VKNVPGVTDASATEYLPLTNEGYMGGRFTVEGSGPQMFSTLVPVAAGYFRTMGSRLLAGREFADADRGDADRAEPIAIVNEEFARAFGGPSAVLGRMTTASRMASRRIVGVVGSVRDAGPSYPVSPQVFVPSRSPRSLMIVVRVAGDARDRIALIRETVAAVDPAVPVFDVQTMSERLDRVLARPRFYTTTVLFFGVLALFLAIIGVYGVVGHNIAERIREMGVRLALGTTPQRLRGNVLARMLIVVGCGLLPGAALALGLTGYLRDLIRGSDAQIPTTLLLAMLTVTCVAALSIWLATVRIKRLDIIETLRAD